MLEIVKIIKVFKQKGNGFEHDINMNSDCIFYKIHEKVINKC